MRLGWSSKGMRSFCGLDVFRGLRVSLVETRVVISYFQSNRCGLCPVHPMTLLDDNPTLAIFGAGAAPSLLEKPTFSTAAWALV